MNQHLRTFPLDLCPLFAVGGRSATKSESAVAALFHVTEHNGRQTHTLSYIDDELESSNSMVA